MGDFLRGNIIPAKEINSQQKSEMFGLLSEYFYGYTPDNFERDLENKNDVILLRKDDGTIRGFSTIQILESSIDDKIIRALFSGDTIIDKDYWGANELFQVWIPYVIKKKDESPQTPFYWFLLSSGYRTYKYLPTFFNKFYPSAENDDDKTLKQILDRLCLEKFKADYDPKRGIVRFSHSKERLKPELSEVVENQKRNKDVAFYLEKNPGHSKGDELACLTEISRENFKRFILKRLSLL